jgi:hypothetical protein
MAVGDKLKLTTIAQNVVGGKTAVNSYYFEQADVLVFDTPEEDLFERFLAQVKPTLVSLFTNNLSIVTVSIGLGPTFETTFQQTVIWTGTITGDPMPAQNCGVLKYRTATPGRRERGRLFLYAAGESSNSIGSPSGAYLTTLGGLGDSLLNTMSSANVLYAGWYWGMFSKADQEFKRIATYSAGLYWGSQLDRRGIY